MKKGIVWVVMALMSTVAIAQDMPCDGIQATSDAQEVYGNGETTDADSVTAINLAIEMAKESINQQVNKQLKNVAAIYVQGINSNDSYKDLMRMMTNISSTADRVMDKIQPVCEQVVKTEDGLYQAQVVYRLQVEYIYRFLQENYNNRIFNIERFKTIYSNNLRYEY